MMWGTAGSVEIDGYMGEGSGVQDHHLYRWDWLNPRLDVSITTLELQVQRPGVTWWVAGASKLDEL